LTINTAVEGTPDVNALVSVHRAEVKNTTAATATKKSAALADLASSLFYRYKQSAAAQDLDEAITTIAQAVELTDDPTKPSRLSSSGVYFQTRFMRVNSDNLQDLQDAIKALSDAINATLDDDLSKPSRVSNLASCFQLRFQKTGVRGDIDDAITQHRLAVQLASEIDKPSRHSSLGNALYTRFKKYREPQDVTDAIAALQLAVSAAPDTDPSKYIYHGHNGIYLQAQFKLTGEREAIDDAVENLRKAVEFASDNLKSKYRAELGSCLEIRFQNSGDAPDLADAVNVLRQAVGDARDEDSDTPVRLSNFGHCLYTHFKQDVSNTTAIDDAIEALERAVRLTAQENAVDKSARASNLAIYHLARVKRLSQPTVANLDAMVTAHRQAVDLTPVDHASRAIRLTNLGSALQLRFERANPEPGALQDIDDAIAKYHEAANPMPNGPEKAGRLSVIAGATYLRFKRTKEAADIETATTTYEEAVNMTVDDDPHKAARVSNLAKFVAARKRVVLGNSRNSVN
jgi:tetratricopeptide (TPR) repeat protein